jgi:PAS domain S-box-containing protein
MSIGEGSSARLVEAQAMLDYFGDMAQQKQAEEARRTSEERFRDLVETTSDWVWEVDADTRYTYASPKVRDVLGYEPEEVLGRTPYELMPAAEAARVAGAFAPIAAAREPFSCLLKTNLHKDGHAVVLETTGVPIFGVDGMFCGYRGIDRDITARMRAEEALRASEERFRTLFNTMSEGFALCEIICDERGKPADFRYLQVNPAFEKQTGLKPAQVTGKRALEVIPGLEPRWIEVYGEVALSGEPARFEDHVQALDRYFEVFAFSPARGQFAAVFVEISARVKAQEAMRRANEKLEEASRAKDHFLAVLSHELRTPLTPVLMTAQVMEADSALTREQREAMRMIRRNVELEARLIDDLLDLTRIARGKLELSFTTVDLHERLGQVVAMCESDMVAKQLHLGVELGAVSHHVPADAARLQQILWNLLKNAVKFTPVGGSVHLRTENPDDEHVAIEVKDSGMGIEPELLPRMFDAFEQGGKTVPRQFGGLGLGLAISKGLVELHGGTLVAESEGPGKGARFTLTLRRTAGAPRGRPSVGESASLRGLARGRQVLLVEDHADTARVMTNLLRDYGFGVTLTRSVQEAMQALAGGAFDLLISDIGLPDGSGLELMRHGAATGPMKAIALSGYGMEEDLRKSREAGFQAHLIKPVDLKALERTLVEMLREPRGM